MGCAAIPIYDDRAPGILQLRFDSQEAGTGVAAETLLPHAHTYPQYLALCQVNLRTLGTAEDSPEFKLLWGEYCQVEISLTEFPAWKVI